MGTNSSLGHARIIRTPDDRLRIRNPRSVRNNSASVSQRQYDQIIRNFTVANANDDRIMVSYFLLEDALAHQKTQSSYG